MCFQICRHLEVPMDHWWLPQSWRERDSWVAPSYGDVNIGTMDDQSSLVFWLIFSDKAMTWDRGKLSCLLFGWLWWLVVERPPTNHTWVCPKIPKSHSWSSFSLVRWHHLGLPPFWDINPSSCGFSVEFAAEAKYLLDEHHIALVDGGMRYHPCGKRWRALAKNDPKTRSAGEILPFQAPPKILRTIFVYICWIVI